MKTLLVILIVVLLSVSLFSSKASAYTYKELIEMTDKDLEEAVDNMSIDDLLDLNKEIADMIIIEMLRSPSARKNIVIVFSNPILVGKYRKTLLPITTELIKKDFEEVLNERVINIMAYDLVVVIINRIKLLLGIDW